KAWDTVQGNGTKVAVFDTGCQANIPDLNGKTDKGYDATTFGARMTVLAGPGLLGDIAGAVGGAASSGAQTDVHGHGTWVATAAAATANNSSNTAGVAPKSRVYPVQIAGSGGTTDDIAIMAGLLNMFTTGNRIVNISYGAPPPVGFT
ncbi:MAG TPA: S8 family serine peptidase, partial [Candidatus Melainabacteria bacterium]|nr:S8 family serine peptidase [Candidatus Melainabacteria bacterium]